MRIESETITTEKPGPSGVGKLLVTYVAYAEFWDTAHPEEEAHWQWWVEMKAETYGLGGEIISTQSYVDDTAETWIGEPPTRETLTRELRGVLDEAENA